MPNGSLWKLRPKNERSIYSPFGVRIYGLVKIAEGIAIVLFGKRAPGWTLHFAFWSSKESAKRRRG